MLSSYVDDQQPTEYRSVDEIERQLLALGPMPCRGKGSWEPKQWARYDSLMKDLVARLNWAALHVAASAPSV
jgi:hypothetical protein